MGARKAQDRRWGISGRTAARAKGHKGESVRLFLPTGPPCTSRCQNFDTYVWLARYSGLISFHPKSRAVLCQRWHYSSSHHDLNGPFVFVPHPYRRGEREHRVETWDGLRHDLRNVDPDLLNQISDLWSQLGTLVRRSERPVHAERSEGCSFGPGGCSAIVFVWIRMGRKRNRSYLKKLEFNGILPWFGSCFEE